jgi:rhodanese-related sulfurtransferase
VEAACAAIARCGQVLLAMHDAEEAPSDIRLADAPCSAEDAAAMTLRWNELGAFLAAHPKAHLLDVREAAEHHASRGIRYGTLAAINVPLSSIATLPVAWLESKAAPIVLVCRSGNRSLKAALWLQSQGYTQVRHVHGGLALRPASISAALTHSPSEKIMDAAVA